MANKNQNYSKKKGKRYTSKSFSELNVYKKLEEVKKRISNVNITYGSVIMCKLANIKYSECHITSTLCVCQLALVILINISIKLKSCTST